MRVLERAAAHVESADPEAWATIVGLQATALRGSGRVAEALAALGSALHAVPAGPIRAAILLQRSRLLLDLFRASEALDDLRVVLEQHRSDGDQHGELEALLALGRAEYILSLDRQEFAPSARATYEEALRLAEHLGDQRAMANALTPTVWFSDYWSEYAPIAQANAARAFELARSVGDPDLLIDAEFAVQRTLPAATVKESGEDLLARLEARRDLVRLKEHCFWMMWVYLGAAEFGRCVAICDRGLELATQLGSAPVQYGSIKAIALARCGRFDEVEAALAQEITDDDHPFGHAIARLARTEYLATVGALEQAAAEGVAAFHEATMVSRRWMQQWLVNLLTSVRVRLERQGRPVPSSLSDLLDDSPIRRSVPARAEVELADGRPDVARDLLEPELARLAGEGRIRELLDARLLHAEAALADGDAAGAVGECRTALAAALDLGYATIAWRLRVVLALAAEATGDAATATEQRARAAAEFGVLRDRITDAALRTGFGRDAPDGFDQAS